MLFGSQIRFDAGNPFLAFLFLAGLLFFVTGFLFRDFFLAGRVGVFLLLLGLPQRIVVGLVLLLFFSFDLGKGLLPGVLGSFGFSGFLCLELSGATFVGLSFQFLLGECRLGGIGGRRRGLRGLEEQFAGLGFCFRAQPVGAGRRLRSGGSQGSRGSRGSRNRHSGWACSWGWGELRRRSDRRLSGRLLEFGLGTFEELFFGAFQVRLSCGRTWLLALELWIALGLLLGSGCFGFIGGGALLFFGAFGVVLRLLLGPLLLCFLALRLHFGFFRREAPFLLDPLCLGLRLLLGFLPGLFLCSRLSSFL